MLEKIDPIATNTYNVPSLQVVIDKINEIVDYLVEGKPPIPDMILSRTDWETIRRWHREMMSRVPNNELSPWLSLGLLLKSIEDKQTGR